MYSFDIPLACLSRYSLAPIARQKVCTSNWIGSITGGRRETKCSQLQAVDRRKRVSFNSRCKCSTLSHRAVQMCALTFHVQFRDPLPSCATLKIIRGLLALWYERAVCHADRVLKKRLVRQLKERVDRQLQVREVQWGVGGGARSPRRKEPLYRNIVEEEIIK